MSIASVITSKEVSRGVKGLKRLISEAQIEMRKEKDDKEFISMLKGDIKDFQRVITLLKAKNVNALVRKIEDMDTDPRDEVLAKLGKSVSVKLGWD